MSRALFGIALASLWIGLMVALTGCVSLGFHQRALADARREEVDRALRWIRTDRLDLLEARSRRLQ